MPSQPQRRHPLVRLDDTARQHRRTRLDPLTDDVEPSLVQPAESGQVRTGERSVRQVEVFPMGSVRTPICGGSRPLPGLRRAALHYTLICEEPELLVDLPGLRVGKVSQVESGDR